jgi:putative serine protease PepD
VSVPPIGAGNESVASVAKELLPSTVQIMADHEGEHLGSTGSGWVFDRQGHVITNNHVVAGAADGGDIQVVDHSGRSHKADLIGTSTVYDIAVLYVAQAKKIDPVSLGSSEAMNVGDPVVAIGSPLGLNETVTSGIISALNRPVTTGESSDDASYINAVQTDAAINPGNSGGPLVSMQGQVIGVNSAIATTGGSVLGGESGNIGVGFAIPIEQVMTTADQILRTGKARYPVIGAQVVTGGDRDGGGAVIDSVVANAPADDAGLEEGDVVTAVDDQTITDGQSLIVQIRTHVPGDTITLTVRRDGKVRQVEVTLAGEEG